MTSFVMKIILNPIALWLSAILFTGLEFGLWYQPMILGLILAVAGTALEYAFLKRGTLYFSTVLDLAATLLIVYYVTPYFAGAVATFMGSLLTAVLFFFIEFPLHRYLLRTGRTRKAA